MKVKIIVHTLLLCSFSFVQSMESMINSEIPITDENLQKLIHGTNKDSLNMVSFVRKQASKDYVKLTPYTIKPYLSIKSEQINSLFLANIEDDELRPLLLYMGANINAQTEDNRNCLWFTKRPELLEDLIQRGAIVDAPEKHNNTTRLYNLLCCLEQSDGYENIIAARVLLTHKANPNIIPHNGSFLLHKIVQCPNLNLNMKVKATTLLCEHNADPNKQDRFYEVPLISAIKEGLADIVTILLLNGAQADTPCDKDEDGNEIYPLHIAIQETKTNNSGNCIYEATIIPAIVILLLEHDANPNRPYPSKNMPLHVAVLRGQRDIIRALINHNAEKHHLGEHGRTAFDLAQPEQRYQQLTKEIVDLLIPASPNEILAFSTTDYAPTKDCPKRNSSKDSLQRSSSKSKENCILQ